MFVWGTPINGSNVQWNWDRYAMVSKSNVTLGGSKKGKKGCRHGWQNLTPLEMCQPVRPSPQDRYWHQVLSHSIDIWFWAFKSIKNYIQSWPTFLKLKHTLRHTIEATALQPSELKVDSLIFGTPWHCQITLWGHFSTPTCNKKNSLSPTFVSFPAHTPPPLGSPWVLIIVDLI